MVFSSFKSFRREKHVKEYLLMYVSSNETKNTLSVNVMLRKSVNRHVTIKLYIRTRGRTSDASCTNAVGPQDDKRVILHAR